MTLLVFKEIPLETYRRGSLVQDKMDFQWGKRVILGTPMKFDEFCLVFSFIFQKLNFSMGVGCIF